MNIKKYKCYMCNVKLKKEQAELNKDNTGRMYCNKGCSDWNERLSKNCFKCNRVLPQTLEQRRLYGGICRPCDRVLDRKLKEMYPSMFTKKSKKKTKVSKKKTKVSKKKTKVSKKKTKVSKKKTKVSKKK